MADEPLDTTNMLKIYMQAYMKPSSGKEAEIYEFGYWNQNFLAGATTNSRTKLKEFARFLKNHVVDTNVAYGYKIWGKQEALVESVVN